MIFTESLSLSKRRSPSSHPSFSNYITSTSSSESCPSSSSLFASMKASAWQSMCFRERWQELHCSSTLVDFFQFFEYFTHFVTIFRPSSLGFQSIHHLYSHLCVLTFKALAETKISLPPPLGLNAVFAVRVIVKISASSFTSFFAICLNINV